MTTPDPMPADPKPGDPKLGDPANAERTPADLALARLERVELDGEGLSALTPLCDADREQAVADLTAGSHFEPLTRTRTPGPYVLYLSIRAGRLLFDVRDRHEAPLTAIGLALGPFHGLVKDYQLLVDSHLKAMEEGREARIQAIDMGRRGLHNEGAELMRQRLAGKIEIDFDTARRLFTLVCVLHHRVTAR